MPFHIIIQSEKEKGTYGAMAKEQHCIFKRAACIMLMAVMAFSSAAFLAGGGSYAASISASGTVKASGVTMHKEPRSASKQVVKLSGGTEVSIIEEVYSSRTSTKEAYRWYKVKSGKKTGYVKAARISSIEYGDERGVTVDDLVYREGPGTTFMAAGVLGYGREIKILLPARRKGSSRIWYRTSINGSVAYIRKTDVARTSPPEPSPEIDMKGRPRIARALLSNPTKGGKVRIVYTFTSKNCRKLFAVKGYGGVTTPQGLAYTGKRYYVLFGNNAGQRIVTYSSKGKRLKATRFAFAIGHPNGMTWDPYTGLCYIFKGHQKRIYTWDPKTGKFGKSKTPYNASGGAYDASTGMIYASSLPCMYTYGSDGEFRLDAAFGRCRRSFQHSAQDCGAGGGFLFHAVSGANYRTANYLDVYRISDRKYLGSIKVTLGEIESAVVNRNGYVELLINHSSTVDYIWRTPLNINDLK